MAMVFSCRKNPTAPPTQNFTFGPSITIEQLRTLWTGVNIKFTSNTTLYAVVTADETSGQLYKQVYVRDNSGTFIATKNYGAISLHFLNYSTNGILYQGDSIAINLNGVTLDKSSGGSLQLDSIPTSHFPTIKIIKSGLNPQPLIATLPQLNTFDVASGRFIYDAQLVQLNNVEFVHPNVGTTYAIIQNYSAYTPPLNINKYICDARGNTVVAYNSGYSNFAGQLIPSNSGTITALANLYNTVQLNIRSFQDINLISSYIPTIYDTITQNFSCAALYSKNPMMTAGWQTFDLQGNLFWQGAPYGSYPNYKYSPTASNYKTSTTRNDIWLISPPIVDVFGTTGYSKKIDFSTAFTYGTNARLLSVLVSNQFDGTHVIPSQWQDISGFFPYIPNSSSQSSTGFPNFYFVSNGAGHFPPNGSFSSSPVSISFTGSGTKPNFYVAFRFQSNTSYSDSTGSTYFLGTLMLRD